MLLEDGKPEELAVNANSGVSVLTTVFSTLGRGAVVLEIFMGAIATIFLAVELGCGHCHRAAYRTLTGTVGDLYTGTKPETRLSGEVP